MRAGSREESPMEGIDEFISSIAAVVPLLPAGGSAAAMAGALAAALGEMMAGVTEGRQKFASVQSRIHDVHAKLKSLRDVLRALIQEDVVSYKSLLDAVHLPRETEEQKAVRDEAVEKSIRKATETPLRTARAAFEVLEYLSVLIEIGNPHAKSDVAVGSQLAYAAIKAGQYNVLANMRIMKNASYAEGCRAEVSDLVLRGGKILQHIDSQITRC